MARYVYDYTQDLPSKPLGNELIPYATPLHVRDLVLQILKDTFAEFPDDYPYKYIADDFEGTGVFFDVPHNKESGVFGRKPLILVTNETQSTSPVSLSDLAMGALSRSLLAHTTLVEAALSVRFLGKVKAEIEILAQLVFGILTSYRTILPGTLGIHCVSSISLGPVSRMDQDDQSYTTTVNVNYVMQYKWQISRDHDSVAAASTSITAK